MKRIIALVTALLMVVCLFAACGGSDDSNSSNSSSDPTKEVDFNRSDVSESSGDAVKIVDLSAVLKQINDQFDLGAKRELTDSERYYSISKDDLKQFFAQKPESDTEFNEIVLCEAADADAVSRIEARLNKALDTAFNRAKSYSKEDLDTVQKCNVITNGNYVYLVISPQAAEIEALIASQLG